MAFIKNLTFSALLLLCLLAFPVDLKSKTIDEKLKQYLYTGYNPFSLPRDSAATNV